MDTNYFVCTLGQASSLSHGPRPFHVISDFLSQQSKRCGSKPAVSFPIPRKGEEWSHRFLTFKDIDDGMQVFASRLAKTIEVGERRQTVALLCHSSPEFLFTWLGLMRLGCSVLLLAPQCRPAAMLHLCKLCNVSLLFYDSAHASDAKETERLQETDSSISLCTQPIPLKEEEGVFQVIQEQGHYDLKYPSVEETDVAYLHHTSGTSSGLPKPIPQTHRGAIGVLPHLPGSPCRATFTTTPLYHGGIADLFRSWTSDSPIWLFPSKDVPVTARNICKCLDIANLSSLKAHSPPIRYFSSVPFVLQMLAADEDGLEKLKQMDIVGVGGAALPVEVGNRLVGQDVNLISRFGSAECGFLLSSYRDFSADKEWRYLRNQNPSALLDFQDHDDSLSELVVRPGWPHMAKSNRDDGSFATADLFAKHPKIENAWLYHSRADAQLTLLTGKKFDPAPLEAEIATSQFLDDVLIFGDDRPYPGALLLRSENEKDCLDEKLIETIWPSVERLNKGSQDHARISRSMLVPVSHQIKPLEKSSKGTVIRKAAEARFSKYISKAYETENDGSKQVDDEKLSQHLIDSIQLLVPGSGELTEETDLFSYGVDSIACMQLRGRLRRLIPNCVQDLPLSVVEDCGTVRGLSEYVLRKRRGAPDADTEDEKHLMLELVEDLTVFEQDTSSKPRCLSNGNLSKSKRGQVVVLTGATGALGAHILDLLRKSNMVSTIYCLVRGADETAAKERVSKALKQRNLADLSLQSALNDKIKILQAQLGDPKLGLPLASYDKLAAEVDVVLHVAWTVNFRLKLQSFVKDNLAGIRNLIDLARATKRDVPPRFIYCSSTAAILNGTVDQSGRLLEQIVSDPSSASPLGYSRSKWVAEHICSQAHHQTELRGRISVIRVGQLSGDSKTGIWNTKEAWPMMLSTAKLIRCLPNLGGKPLDWLPVDIAAEAFLQAAFTQESIDIENRVPVYHILNPHQQPTWHDMLAWLKEREDFEIVDPPEWVSRLEKSSYTEHSALKLLGLWKETYCSDARGEETNPMLSIEKTQRVVPALRDIQPLDEEYIEKIWGWVQEHVH